MKTKLFKIVLASGLSALFATGCVNQETLSNSTVQQDAAIGAVTGAVVGGNVGDGSGSNIAVGAVLGAIAGGAVGDATREDTGNQTAAAGWQ